MYTIRKIKSLSLALNAFKLTKAYRSNPIQKNLQSIIRQG